MWSASRPGRFTPGEGTKSTCWIGGWMGAIIGVDGMDRTVFYLPGLELRSFGCPAFSQSRYLLRSSYGRNISSN
jgi:hypothetical protein